MAEELGRDNTDDRAVDDILAPLNRVEIREIRRWRSRDAGMVWSETAVIKTAVVGAIMEAMEDRQKDITRLLLAWRDGRQEALEQLAPMIYGELHRLAHRYLRDERHKPLETTELVHEAFLRLVGSDLEWHGRRHFYVVAARQMRRILVDLARRRAAQKRQGREREITLREGQVAGGPPVDVLALDEALRELAVFDERKCRVIELSYFTGLAIPAIAESLGVSTATVERDLRTARAWLAKTLRGSAAEGAAGAARGRAG